MILVVGSSLRSGALHWSLVQHFMFVYTSGNALILAHSVSLVTVYTHFPFSPALHCDSLLQSSLKLRQAGLGVSVVGFCAYGNTPPAGPST